MEEQYNYQSESGYDEDMDIMELVGKLWNERKLIIKWICVSIVLGLIVGFSIPREYTSNAKLAPESSSRSSLGSLGSLAALAGVRVSSGGGSDAMSPDLYPDIVSSAPFMVDMFATPLQYQRKGKSIEMDLYTYVKDENVYPWWSAIVGLPFKALAVVRGIFNPKVERVEGYADVDPTNLTYEQNGIINCLRQRISLLIDKKTSVINIDVMMQNPEVAAQVADKVLEKLQSYIIQYRTDKAVKDLEFTESLYEEARDKYYASQQKYAQYMDAHQGIVLQSVKTEQERLKNEMDLDYQLYNSMAQELQLGKAKVQEQTPVFTVYQPPMVPLLPTKPSKVKTLIVFMFLGCCAAAAWVLFGRDIIDKFKNLDVKE